MCIFCKVVLGEAPCYRVYKSSEVTAFLDVNPIAPGHTLIIPNAHVERLDQLENKAAAAELMQALIDVPNRLIQAGICTDFTILSDNGVCAEQDIPHLHFHVIPRHAEEDFQIHAPTNEQAKKESELLSIWNKLKKSN